MKRWLIFFVSLWYRGVRRVCCRLFFSRVTILNRENLPAKGPVLFLALHRNGAADGFVYYRIRPRMTAMLSRQLRTSAFIRLFFTGIEVVRDKDVREGEDVKVLNKRAMQECVDLLNDGGELLLFPEGTSSLGPAHLPFKAGAAHIAAKALANNVTLPVIPIGIRYECAWAFRSRVEMMIGKPIDTRGAGVRELRTRFEAALEEVGVNVASAEDQERIQKLAYISTLGTDRSYYESLKQFEKSMPRHLEEMLDERGLFLHQGVPLFPAGSRWLYLLALLLSAPIVALAMCLNIVPLFGGWAAAAKFADDRNVIAFWKIIIGVPLFVLWSGALTLAGLVSGQSWLLLMYWLITFFGHALWYRTRKLAVAVGNGFFHAALQQQAMAWRAAVLAFVEQTEKQARAEEGRHELHCIAQ